MKELKQMSEGLRGSVSKDVDSAGIVSKVKDFAKNYLNSVQDIQGHFQAGDKVKAAAAIKSAVGDNSRALADASKEVKAVNDLDYFPSLEGTSNAELAEFIQPQVFDQLVGETKDLLNILEGIDLDSLPSSNPKPKTKSKSSHQKPNQGKGFKFDESNPLGFDYASFQSTFHESRHNVHHHDYFKQPSLMKKLLRKHKAMSKSGKLRPQAPSFFKNNDIIMAKHQLRQDAMGDTCPNVCDDTDMVSLFSRCITPTLHVYTNLAFIVLHISALTGSNLCFSRTVTAKIYSPV